ncbi:type I restriction-modification system subunit M [Roseateles koreensis]|uniref:site-specific DNA-methyltransferase (adenine-specific) n=1 Tax=Roseateles koreensis TaxID=2987526 RepID=A0ABT5KY32_9BURK|nr:class I SAM-dependent DNA methyltransferase [Roseateles koreensis]MDC8787268.1 class I SAM-dependent DNA methyltransferase [Roseateles koreensis]
MSRITQQELESYLWGAAVLLRGLIDAGDYKQFIFPLLFYKRVADVWEEEYQAALGNSKGDLSYAQFAENHRFQIPDGAHWNDVRQTPKNVGAAIQRAMRTIETANPGMLDGIFGDAAWTNRERLPDETLKDLIEHFSTQTLSVANVPEDELGNAYEYLIKKFADDSGHTAAEFYTNRTVVHLMTQLLSPQAGESIYDPTCGTGGMLISALDEVKRSGGEYRTLKLYGQERNLITSSIARMNLFLHGVEDFDISRGDTLAEPKHIEGDRLRQFDVILANPPYSIKQWDREAWSSDKWGRNELGTPPQGRADYAFQQHILTSLTAKGRCAVLWPHGVLFRNEEQTMRAKMIEQDWVEAVIGLGPNLFYNSPMESCIVICNRKKAKARKGKVIFIDAVNEVTRERAQSFLTPDQQQRILTAYKKFADVTGLAKVASLTEISAHAANLSIPLYVKRIAAAVATDSNGDALSLRSAWDQWQTDGRAFWQQMDALESELDSLEAVVRRGDAHLIPADFESLDDIGIVIRTAIRQIASRFPQTDLKALAAGFYDVVEVRQRATSRSTGSTRNVKEDTLAFVTHESLGRKGGSTWKISNIIFNMKKLVDVGPDVLIAGAGGATAPAWLLPWIGLYVLNKLIRYGNVAITEVESTLLRALWLNRNDKREVRDDLALQMVNVERRKLRLGPITQQQFDEAETHLIELRCISKRNGVIHLQERVVVTN